MYPTSNSPSTSRINPPSAYQPASPHHQAPDPDNPSQSASKVASPSPLGCYRRRGHLYRGHRSRSLIVEDLDELTEWRARQRTFDGAYLRSALGCSFFALTITKMFRKDLSKIGLEFAVLALLILSISYIRRRRLNHDFSDAHVPVPPRSLPNIAAPRIWGREYRTPGDFVLLLGAAMAAIQISLIFLFVSLD
ncbi:hypothetical protein PCANC_24423 [Puccinia coronata f. sp. avenae]|uniref:DUF202 domain-containing protein n=1 Tax=Puccinia coronata f. sp. avenae TaxID=200324 RepID=A0A2N5U8N3_9BASI|nr:hypothetical protein PCANC_24423 [Puccinia coronata f. sp. avenae]PLW14512.1 hypothetical protein PCASD_19548 [Puccinia coronata f. sp. avenae]PLW34095.1 hypothetical protein PCASD_13088 [Puccinia coronata f. sp. avenae]